MIAIPALDRAALVQRGRRLSYATLAYNSLEGVVAIGAGAAAGSVALVGFGVDSVIELAAGATALWRLNADADADRRARTELHAHRIIGVCFLALAVYVGVDAVLALSEHSQPSESWIGMAVAAGSLGVMPYLARSKRRIAVQLGSGALTAEAQQTMLCTYLSAILLVGLALNALLSWWWADPVAALAMVPLIAREGAEGLRGRSTCDDGCHSMPRAE